MITLRFPNITGNTPEKQVEQLKDYLYNLVQELNWAFSTLEAAQEQEGEKKNGNV